MPEKPDWIANRLAGLDDKYIQENNIDAGNYQIEDSDAYWGSKKIQETFSNNRADFDKWYNDQRGSYMGHSYLAFAERNTVAPLTPRQAESGHITELPRYSSVTADPWGQSFNMNVSEDSLYGEKQKGWKESAVKNVKLGDKFIDFKDYKGDALLKFAINSEDGSMKLNDDGKPYLVPLERGEELTAYDQVYTPWGERLGTYGYDYSWGKMAKGLLGNPLEFLGSAVDAIAEPVKGILSFTAGENSDIFKNVVDIENWGKSLRPGFTEQAEDGLFNKESLSNLGQQVTYQLVGMAAVGGIVGLALRSQKAGMAAAKAFGAILAADSVGELARASGLSNKESYALTAATIWAFYPIMNLSAAVLGGASAFAVGKNFAKSATREGVEVLSRREAVEVVKGIVKEEGEEIAKKGFSKAAMRAGSQKITSRAKNFLLSLQDATEGGVFKNIAAGIEKLPVSGAVHSAIEESLEETLEQTAQSLLKGVYNVYSDILPDEAHARLGSSKEAKFQLDLVQELKDIGQSAFGGAFGGTLMGGMMHKLHQRAPATTRSISDIVMAGQEKDYFNWIGKMRDQGRLAPAFLNTDNQPVKEGEVTKNEAAYNILKGMGDYLVTLRDEYGLQDVVKNNKSRENIASQLGDLDFMVTSSVGKDASNLFSEIVNLKGQLTDPNGSKNPDFIKNVEEQISIKEAELDKIKKGEFSSDYVAEGIYNIGILNGTIASEPRKARLDGRNFVRLSRMIPVTLKDNATHIANIEEKYKEKDAAATFENYKEASPTKLESLQTEAAADFSASLKTIDPSLLQAYGLTQENFFDQSKAQDLDITKAKQSVDTLNALLENEEIQGEQRKAIEETAAKADLYEAIRSQKEETKAAQEKPLTPKDILLTTVKKYVSGERELFSSEPISIENQLQRVKDTKSRMVADGKPFIESSGILKNIQESAAVRKEQIQGLLITGNQLSNLKDPFQIPAFEELQAAYKKLVSMEGEINALVAESDKNAADPSAAINKLVISKLNRNYEMLEEIGKAFAGSDFSGITDTINLNITNLAEALEAKDPERYYRVLRDVEDEIHDNLSTNKDEILKKFAEQSSFSVDNIARGSKDLNTEEFIRSFDYLRGILSLKSVDFWNALNNVSSRTALNIRPSWEQVAVAKEVVSSLIGNLYTPHYMSEAALSGGLGLKWHYSALIDGKAGTGKTEVAIPLIVGMVQYLNRGGKAIITSYKNSNINKIDDTRNKVRAFFGANSTVSIVDSNATINEILQNSAITEANTSQDSVNLIVYDEATLLTQKELKDIHSRLDVINKARAKNGMTPLRLLFTADTLQNAQPIRTKTGELPPASDPMRGEHFTGIINKSNNFIPRSSRLTYQFRTQNESLRNLVDYLEELQSTKNHKPLAVEYSVKDYNGGRMFKDLGEFHKFAIQRIAAMKTDGTISNAVYITDKSEFELPKEITNSGIKVDSFEAQGKQWDYVFFDPRITNPQSTYDIRDWYTAVSRAEKGVFIHVGPNSTLSSKPGTVYTAPVVSTTDTPEAWNSRMQSILGGDINIDPNTGYTTAEQPDLSEFYASFEGAVQQEPEVTDWIRDRLARAARSHPLQLMTYYTRPDDSDMKLKREIMNDLINNGLNSKNHSLMITIAAAEHPNYQNAFASGAPYDFPYKVFIEAVTTKGDRKVSTILGVLNKEVAQFISDSGLMKGRSADQPLHIGINSDVLRVSDTNALNFRDVKIFGKKKDVSETFVNRGPEGTYIGNLGPLDNYSTYTLGELKRLSPTVSFGKVRIATDEVKFRPANQNSTSSLRAGQAFIGVSFLKNSAEIDSYLDQNKDPGPDIKLIPINSKQYAIQAVMKSFEPHLVNGKLDIHGNEELRAKYNMFWGHNALSLVNKQGKLTDNRIARIFNDAAKKEPNKAFSDFMRSYTERIDTRGMSPEEIELARDRNNLTVLLRADQKKVYNRAYYFLADYMEAKANKDAKLPMFEKAMETLMSHPEFGGKVYADPRIHKSKVAQIRAKTVHSAHVTATEAVNDQLYDTVMSVYLPKPDEGLPPLSAPIIALNEKAVLGAIRAATIDPSTVEGMNIVEKVQIPTEETGPDVIPEYRESRSGALGTFFDTYFTGNRSTLFRNTINRFKRDLYSHIYNTSVGQYKDVNTAINTYLSRLQENTGGFDPEELKTMPDQDTDIAKEMYMDAVIQQEFDFLISEYYPAINYQEEISEGKTVRKYGYQITHSKAQGFDSEQRAWLDETANEMLKTHLFNAPLVVQTSTGLKSIPNRFFAENELQDVMNVLKGASTIEEAEEAMRKSGSLGALSFYYRFLSPTTYSMDGGQQYSLYAMNHPEVRKMVNAIVSMLKSAELYIPAGIDLQASDSNLPTSQIRPNLIRENGIKAMESVTNDPAIIKTVTGKSGNEVFTIGDLSITESRDYSDKQVIEAVRAIGIKNFSQDHIDDIKAVHVDDIASHRPSVLANSGYDSKALNYIMDTVVFPSIRLMTSGKAPGFQMSHDLIYNSILRVESIHQQLDIRDKITGKRSYLLRNTAPVFETPETIDRIRRDEERRLSDKLPPGLHEKNILVKGGMRISGFFDFKGVSDKYTNRSHSQMTTEELIESDMFWGFAHTLQKRWSKTGQYDMFSLSPAVYSDSGTDIRPIVVIDGQGQNATVFRSNKNSWVDPLFESNKDYYEKLEKQLVSVWGKVPSIGTNIHDIRGLAGKIIE